MKNANIQRLLSKGECLGFSGSERDGRLVETLERDEEFAQTFAEAVEKVLLSDFAAYLVKEAWDRQAFCSLSAYDLKNAVIFLRFCKGNQEVCWQEIFAKIPYALQFLKLPTRFEFAENEIESVFSTLSSEKHYEALLMILEQSSNVNTEFVLSELADFEQEQQLQLLGTFIGSVDSFNIGAVLSFIFKLHAESQEELIRSVVRVCAKSFGPSDIDLVINLPYADELMSVFAQSGCIFSDVTLNKCFTFANAAEILLAYMTATRLSNEDGSRVRYVCRPLKPEYLYRVLELPNAREVLEAYWQNDEKDKRPYRDFWMNLISIAVKANGKSE